MCSGVHLACALCACGRTVTEPEFVAHREATLGRPSAGATLISTYETGFNPSPEVACENQTRAGRRIASTLPPSTVSGINERRKVR